MPDYKIRLRIADIVIQMHSEFPLRRLTKKEEKGQVLERFNSFFYRGNSSADIDIKVELVSKLPQFSSARPIFITYHFQNGNENWRLAQRKDTYVYSSGVANKKQTILVNKTFDKVVAYLLHQENEAWTWNISEIIYDFLQVLLINYLAQRAAGIFTHAVGIKDLDGEGLLFAGKSGCGKSTTARIWHSHSRAMVLNDDRIIVRKHKGQFFIYGSPWHGNFSDYLLSRIEEAPLRNLFFIRHSTRNIIKGIIDNRAFSLLYPALFPTFWDKGCLENIVSFSLGLVKDVPCFSLGFVNDKEVIGFVRKEKNRRAQQSNT